MITTLNAIKAVLRMWRIVANEEILLDIAVIDEILPWVESCLFFSL
jgi:hypothetical protein